MWPLSETAVEVRVVLQLDAAVILAVTFLCTSSLRIKHTRSKFFWYFSSISCACNWQNQPLPTYRLKTAEIWPLTGTFTRVCLSVCVWQREKGTGLSFPSLPERMNYWEWWTENNVGEERRCTAPPTHTLPVTGPTDVGTFTAVVRVCLSVCVCVSGDTGCVYSVGLVLMKMIKWHV